MRYRGLLHLALTRRPPAAPVAAQTPAQIQTAVDAAYAKYKNLQEGKNADYIPALAKVDPKVFGIAVVTADGKIYTAGDLTTEVSIQSISKVFTMALVIKEQGPDQILNTIGADATGMRFNSIVSIEQSQKLLGGPEMNALVNPGAIATTSMVSGKSYDEVWGKIAGFYNDFAGRPMKVLEDVYKSEAETNQRNQAIGALMYAYGYIKTPNWQQAVDIYTKQCAVGVNAKDLAIDGGDAGVRGHQPGHQEAAHEERRRAARAGGDGDGRAV